MIIGGLDLETTGFVEPEHRIIEACLVKYDWDKVGPPRLISSQTWRYNPLRNIPAGSSAVHGIFIEDLKGKPTWEKAAHELATECNSCDQIVAHNGIGFDFEFLIMEWDRIKLPIPDFDPFDTMTEGRWSTAFGKVPSLQELCFACGVAYDPEKAHAAEYDVNVMMDCFFYGVKNGHYTL